jgi:hypothetical protein
MLIQKCLFCFIIVIKLLCLLTSIYHRRIDTKQNAYYKSTRAVIGRNLGKYLNKNLVTDTLKIPGQKLYEKNNEYKLLG